MFHNLDFLKAHPTFNKQENIKKGIYYTDYRPRTDSDRPRYKILLLQYFQNLVILLEYEGYKIDNFITIERNYFESTKAHSLEEKCYRFLPKLNEDNTSRPQDGDLLDEKKYWSILNDRFVQGIELCYSRILHIEDSHTSSYKLVSGGILHTRAIATLSTLLSAVENLWESFKSLNIVNKTKFLPISVTDYSINNLANTYLGDTKPNKLSELKEVTHLNDDQNSYRYFYPEDVEAEKKRRRQEAAVRKKQREQERKEMEQEAIEEWGNFGYYAAMVHEGELAPDDPRYPF